MPVITSNGRARTITYDQLVIPGKCVVDFRELTVLRNGCTSPDNIHPRLAILLDIFYNHRNRFLTSDKIADIRYGYAEGTLSSIKNDVSKLRGLIGDKKKPPEVIVSKHGVGYKFVYNGESPTTCLSLEDIFRRLSITGEIEKICIVTAEENLVIETTLSASVNAVFDFFISDTILPNPLNMSEKEEFVRGKVCTSKRHLQSFYRQAVLAFDGMWEASRNNIRAHLVRSQKLKVFRALSSPLPTKLADFENLPMDADKMLDVILNQITLEIEKMMDEPIVRETFFSNSKATVTKANTIDGVVALLFISLFFLSNGQKLASDESLSRDADRYKSKLTEKIREIFSPEEETYTRDDVSALLQRIVDDIHRGIDSYSQDFDSTMTLKVLKIIDGTFNLSSYYRNSPTSGNDKSNTRENDSSVKAR